MLFENIIVLSKFLCSLYEKKIAMMLIKGRAIIKPANAGFFSDNQLAVEIITLDIKTLTMKKNMQLFYPKKFFILEIGLLKGS